MIELEDITKVYRMGKVDVFALNGISISINKGDMVAIVGASGSGKSTMLHVIGCLDKPTSGKYILDGQDISRLNDNKLADIRNKKLGFVFQEFNLLTRITAVANVELPMIYGNSLQKRQRAIKALERV
ncbi:ABC transporter ATP-binding protein, partial [Bacteroidota bacterium]